MTITAEDEEEEEGSVEASANVLSTECSLVGVDGNYTFVMTPIGSVTFIF